MPLGRTYRLLQLMSLLQSGRPHNATQLAELCEVSRRTIFRDFRVLELAGVPVQYDVERQGYLISSTFFLPPVNFTLDEALSVLALAYELGSAQGLPFLSAARAAAMKLEGGLPGHLRDYLHEVTAQVVVQADRHNPLAGSEPFYRQLVEAIARRRNVRLTYDSLFEKEVIQTKVSPYRLLFSRRSWYVVGRSSLHRAVRMFNVGRIRKLDRLDESYRIPPRFSLERHLGNAWHLIREPDRHHVVVRFQPMVAQNVAEVRWHPTQRVAWNPDGTLDFHVDVDGLKEISWWILGYGDQAEVLEPTQLREIIRHRAERMAAIHRNHRPPRNNRRAPS